MLIKNDELLLSPPSSRCCETIFIEERGGLMMLGRNPKEQTAQRLNSKNEKSMMEVFSAVAFVYFCWGVSVAFCEFENLESESTGFVNVKIQFVSLRRPRTRDLHSEEDRRERAMEQSEKGKVEEEGQSKERKLRASLGSLSEDTTRDILQHLDAHSLCKSSLCNKLLRREGKLMAKHIVEYLQKKHFCSRFVLVADLGDEPGRVSHLEMLSRMTREVDVVLLLGGYTTEVTKATIEQDGALIRFEDGRPTLTSRFDQTVVCLHGDILICSPFATEHLDSLTQTQTQQPTSLPDDLCWSTTCVFSNQLLAIGGYRQGIRLDVMHEHLEEDEDQVDQSSKWRAHSARLNTGRYCAAAIEFQGKLFVCGGYGDNGSTLRSVESLSSLVPVADVASEWHVESEMTKSRRDTTLVVFDNELHAVGGDHGGNTTIEKLSKHTNLWEEVTDSNEFRYACAVALVGSKIFLFGGGHGKSEKTFDFFDLRSKKWASQDVGGAYFGEDKRQLPNKVFRRAAILVTPIEERSKNWNDLHP